MDYLSPTNSRVMKGKGPTNANVMIVSEAPTAGDIKQDKPFTGLSGKLFDEILHTAGILRNDCYITHIIKEKQTETDAFIEKRKGGMYESPSYEKYKQILKKEIETVKPNLIIAFGSAALYALIGETKITSYRGSILESTITPGFKVLATIHPAAALKQYIWRHYIILDIKKASTEQQYPEIRRKKRDYIISPTFEQSVKYLNKCLDCNTVAFDIEVSAGEMSCISFATSETSAISIPFTNGASEYFSMKQEMVIMRKIAGILEDQHISKIGQNISFDSTFMLKRYDIKTKNMQDTMIGIAILYPDFEKNLGFITSVYTDIPYYKDEGKNVFSNKVSANRNFWLYNAKDSIVLMEAFPKIVAELDKNNNLDTYVRQSRVLESILFMYYRGIKMDTKGMKKESERVKDEIAEHEARLEELAGEKLNPNSPKQLKEYFYKKKKQKPYMDKGKISTAEKALKQLARKGFEEASIIIKIRELKKYNSTYLESQLDLDGRLRCSMNPVGTKSGRMSSSKTIFGTGMNMQNQPARMKRFMLPDDGYVVFDVDLSQAENRIVAYTAPDATMIDAFETGTDIHSKTASMIFNIPIEDIREMNKLFEKTSDAEYSCRTIGGGKYSHRFWGKKANHSFNYNQSAWGFSLMYEIPTKEAEFIRESYLSMYPGVPRYWRWIRNKIKETRKLNNIFGRKYSFYDRWDSNLLNMAYSFIPQSSVADIINKRGLDFIYDNPDLKKFELLNQIHDSVVFQVKLDDVDEVISGLLKIKQSLETPLHFHGRDFVIPSEFKCSHKNLFEGKEINLDKPDEAANYLLKIKQEIQ